MDGFKKVSEDKHKTVLKHESGHEITIAHAPLSDKMRKQLKSLPIDKEAKAANASPITQNFKGNESKDASISQALAPDSAVLAKGGKVHKNSNPKLEESKKTPPKSKLEAEESNSAMPSPEATAMMASGGQAQQKPAPNTSLLTPYQPMADGGTAQPAPSGTPTPKPNSKPDDTSTYQVGEPGSIGAQITKKAQNLVNFADGGDVAPDSAPQPSAAEHLGSIIGHAVRTAVGAAKDAGSAAAQGASDFVKGAADSAPQAAAPTPPPVDPQLAQASQDLGAMQQPTAPDASAQQTTPDQSPASAGQAPQQADPSRVPQQTDNPGLPGVADQDQPTLGGGYQDQLKGIDQQAAAQGAAGNAQAAIATQGAANEANALKTFQDHTQALDDERNKFVSDIQNGHITPKSIWSGSPTTLGKITTGIGLLLGGMGGGIAHTGNPVLKMLTDNIERDMEAQKQNLEKNQGLLAANMRQFGNLNDATNATRIMMHDALGYKLQAAADKAQSPMAKAAALQAKGALKDATAPMAYQLNMRRTLQGIGQGSAGPDGTPSASNLSSVDPAAFVRSIVPEGQQKPVADEIERAQNTFHMSNPIMQNFDKAANAMSGIGHITSMIKTPREMNALSGLLNTTVTDLTGTARQAEFDNIHDNFLPKPTDTPNDIAIKRQALQQYLQAKSSAPLAKANGIDLTKFRSTNNTPEAKLTPQQQSFATWAKANPGNPKAQMVLKKLGLQ